jgi:gliding motility-associated-like protein
MQFTVAFDTARFSYISRSGLTAGFQSQGMVSVFPSFDDVTHIANGLITFSWTRSANLSIVPDSTIFTVSLSYKGGGNGLVQILENGPTPIELSNASNPNLPYTVASGGVNVVDNITPTVVCPVSKTVTSNGPITVSGLAPISAADNCAVVSATYTASAPTNMTGPLANVNNVIFAVGATTMTYKVSDAAMNMATCSFTVSVTPPAAPLVDTLTLIASPAILTCGQTATYIDILVNHFDSIGSLQYTFKWNKSDLKFDSISMPIGAMNLGLGNFNTTQALSDGLLGFSWTIQNPTTPYLTLADGTKLIRLHYTVLATSNLTSAIQFTSNPVPIEAYNNAVPPGFEVPVKWTGTTVQSIDPNAPLIQCPPSVTVNLQQNQTSVTLSGLTATFSDACDATPTPRYELIRNGLPIISVPNSANASGPYQPGLTTIVYTVTDDAGNSAVCFTDVDVKIPNPVTFYIDSVALGCNNQLPYVDMSVRVRNFADVVGAQFVLSWDETILDFDTITFVGVPQSGFAFNNFSQVDQGLLQYIDGLPMWPDIADGGIFFTMRFNLPLGAINTPIEFINMPGFPFQVYDANINLLNATTQNGVVLTTDKMAPVITNCPADISVSTQSGSCNASVFWPVILVTDDCVGSITLDSNFVSHSFSTGTNLIRYIAKDQVGNADTCQFMVTVKDSSAPVFVVPCPMDQFVQAGNQCMAIANWVIPTAFDTCDNMVMQALSTFAPGQSFMSGTTLVTYTATDKSGNSNTCSFEVNVIESTAPTITCPANLTINITGNTCDTTVFWIPATATDNCPGFVSVGGNFSPGMSLPVGATIVRYTATDVSGNNATCTFTVSVKEGIKPTIQCPPNVTASVSNSMPGVCGGIATWPLPLVNDNCNPLALMLTSTHTSGSFFPLGNTFVTYGVTDASGNVASCNLVVSISDKTAPVFSYCPPEQIFTLHPDSCSVTVNWIAPAETDILESCGLDTLYSLQGFTSPHSFSVGNNAVIYFAIDQAGNLGQCEFKIQVRDTVAPVLATCPKDTVIASTGCSVPFNFVLPGATDNCDNNVTVTSMPANGTILAAGSVTTFKIRAQDNYSNRDSCLFTVTVSGGASSATVGCPQPITITGCFWVTNWAQPNITGFCDSIVSLTVSPIDTGATVNIGTTTVTYTATDAVGVSASCSFNVTVQDPIPPVVTCPAGVTVDVSGGITNDAADFINTATPSTGCTSVALTYNALTTSDNCGNVVNVQTSGPASGGNFAVGATNMTFTSTDGAGNTTTCAFIITVMAIDSAVTLQASTNPACPGDPLTIVAPNITGATYQWAGPGGNFPNASSILINPVTAANAGVYRVTITNNGCTFTSGSGGLAVSVPATPSAIDDMFSIQVSQSDTLRTLLNDVNTSGVTYQLLNPPPGVTQFANGNLFFSGTTIPGTLTFQYEICAENCPDVCDIAIVTLDIKESPCVYEPNIITPNGDDLNDEWIIPCLEFDRYPNNSVVIYNQWGDKVFSASPYKPFPKQGAWNGSLDNDSSKPLPDGVYYYIFRPTPTAAPRKGFIELFR